MWLQMATPELFAGRPLQEAQESFVIRAGSTVRQAGMQHSYAHADLRIEQLLQKN